jgi:RNA polymerase sigma-70 factor (ECF subfamily)
MVAVLSRIEACVPPLRRYASALLPRQQDADALVQATLLRALDQLHAQRGDAEVRAWLFGIMHALSVTRVWRAKRSTTGPLKQRAVHPSGEPEESQPWPEILADLNCLPERERAVVLLVSIEDLTYAEVSRALGIPVGTVMSLLASGRERLRQMTRTEARPCLRSVK